MAKEVKNKKEKNHFFKDFKAELKKVIWPTPKQLVNNTVAVITIVLITAAIVFVLDLAFEKMNTLGITKLKELVDNNSSEISNEVTNEIALENTETQENMANEDVQTSENNVNE